MRRSIALLSCAVAVSACGSNAALKSAQTNTNVQQTETKVEKQVSTCLPTSNGVPDPFLPRHPAERTKFAACTGVSKHAKSFEACVVKVLFGGLPSSARIKKGLAACVEQNA